MIFARIASLTPSFPARPFETETVLIPSRFAVFKWLKKLEKYAKPARTGSFRA